MLKACQSKSIKLVRPSICFFNFLKLIGTEEVKFKNKHLYITFSNVIFIVLELKRSKIARLHYQYFAKFKAGRSTVDLKEGVRAWLRQYVKSSIHLSFKIQTAQLSAMRSQNIFNIYGGPTRPFGVARIFKINVYSSTEKPMVTLGKSCSLYSNNWSRSRRIFIWSQNKQWLSTFWLDVRGVMTPFMLCQF